MTKENDAVHEKRIVYMGKDTVVYCDGKCEKAWGFNSRPRTEDDKWIPDEDLGTAPSNPGTREGDEAKPLHDEPKLNKWCVRECERSNLINIGEGG